MHGPRKLDIDMEIDMEIDGEPDQLPLVPIVSFTSREPRPPLPRLKSKSTSRPSPRVARLPPHPQVPAPPTSDPCRARGSPQLTLFLPQRPGRFHSMQAAKRGVTRSLSGMTILLRDFVCYIGRLSKVNQHRTRSHIVVCNLRCP